MSQDRTSEATVVLTRTATDYVLSDGDGLVFARTDRPIADNDLRDWVYEALESVADDLLDDLYDGDQGTGTE